MILALGLPTVWYLGRAHPTRRVAWMWRLYVPLGLTAILLTASRGAFLAALVELMFVPGTVGRVSFRTKALHVLASPRSRSRVASFRGCWCAGVPGGGGAGALAADGFPPDLPGILVELGILGLFLFVAMMAAVVQPLRRLPPFQRRLWIVLLATLAVGSLSLHLDHRKHVWFVLGLVASVAALRRRDRITVAVASPRGAGAPVSDSGTVSICID